ncbi:MAG TPA: universal stress protein [Anaerolineae bacterium]|nr:universal stress protein [Anaerolineae bacterium]
MGGYRRGPLVERLIGSTVNGVLNQARRPVLLVR